MSIFYSSSRAQYISALLTFLGVSRETMVQEAGVTNLRIEQQRNYTDNEVRTLEDLVNIKASRCEAKDTKFGERIKLARDYLGMNNGQISRKMGVSREIVEGWMDDLHLPTGDTLIKLAEVLNAPVPWLQQGEEMNLASDSHLGVRVGDVSLKCRETLFSLTLSVLVKEANGEDPVQVAAALATALRTNFEMCNAARKAGGRWEMIAGQMSFVPWVPLELKSLECRHRPVETETIIKGEIESSSISYQTWRSVKERCDSLGLASPTAT